MIDIFLSPSKSVLDFFISFQNYDWLFLSPSKTVLDFFFISFQNCAWLFLSPSRTMIDIFLSPSKSVLDFFYLLPKLWLTFCCKFFFSSATLGFIFISSRKKHLWHFPLSISATLLKSGPKRANSPIYPCHSFYENQKFHKSLIKVEVLWTLAVILHSGHGCVGLDMAMLTFQTDLERRLAYMLEWKANLNFRGGEVSIHKIYKLTSSFEWYHYQPGISLKKMSRVTPIGLLKIRKNLKKCLLGM